MSARLHRVRRSRARRRAADRRRRHGAHPARSMAWAAIWAAWARGWRRRRRHWRALAFEMPQKRSNPGEARAPGFWLPAPWRRRSAMKARRSSGLRSARSAIFGGPPRCTGQKAQELAQIPLVGLGGLVRQPALLGQLSCQPSLLFRNHVGCRDNQWFVHDVVHPSVPDRRGNLSMTIALTPLAGSKRVVVMSS
jgi:hypothetical protein